MRWYLSGILVIAATAAYAQIDPGSQAAQQAVQQAQQAGLQAQQISQQAAQSAQQVQQQMLQTTPINNAVTSNNQCASQRCGIFRPTFSIGNGTYAAPITISVTSRSRDAAIYYTTDGSTPTRNSRQYHQPLTISSDTNLRAIAIVSGVTPSRIKSATYKFR